MDRLRNNGDQCPVNKEMVDEISHFLSQFVNRHIATNPEYRNAYELKLWHTQRVLTETVKIGEKIGMDNCDLNIAKIIAILHDIGRFEQYSVYNTFADNLSENHAVLGFKIIQREKLLKSIPYPFDSYIEFAVANHNAIAIESDPNIEKVRFLKLIRDADKIDILNVFLLQDHSKDGISDIIDLGLPDNNIISPEIYNSLLSHRNANYSDIKSISDFRLLKVAWIFDINYAASYEIIRERNYLGLLRDKLPENKKVAHIFDEVSSYITRRFEKGVE